MVSTDVQHHLTHPKYRPDIDGLRAVAVLSVVGFHAFPGWVHGGFIGVDVFFVISGYLISTIIIDSLERNSFSFIEFYVRRINRIFPALLLVMIACLALGWFVLLADEYKQLGKHIAAGAGFVSNFALLGESGYFDNAAETKLLLHLWSLGIEEQFYIAWPLMLWIAWKKKFSLLTITIALAAISFYLNIDKVNGGYVDAAFYSPQTRFWQLLAGSILAYMTLHRQSIFSLAKPNHDLIANSHSPETNGKSLRNVQSVFGVVLIITGVFVITKEKLFPGWWAVLPTLGAMLVISAGEKAWLNRVVLSNRVLVWFGLISFPLYLWHWPLLTFARILEAESLSRTARIATVLISIVLAWLTYKLIEKPIRFGKHIQFKMIGLLVLMVMIGMGGYVIYTKNGFDFRVKQFTKISIASGDFAKFSNHDNLNVGGRQFKVTRYPSKNTIFFIGDSNADQYSPRVDYLISESPAYASRVIFGTGGGCSPIPHVVEDSHPHCLGLTETSLQLVRTDKSISTIVIAAFWPNSLSNNTSFKLEYDDNGKKTPIVFGNQGYEKALSSLARFIEDLRRDSNNARIVLVLNTPFGKELDPKFMASRSILNFPHILQLRTGGVSIKKLMASYDYGAVRFDLINVAKTTGVDVIDPINFLCGSTDCPAIDNEGRPIYANPGHLNAAFSRSYINYLDEVILTQASKNSVKTGLGDKQHH